MNKTAIKNFSIWARKKLIEDITYKAGLIGVSEKGIAQPLSQSTKDLQFFDIGTKDYVQVAGKEIAQRNGLVNAIKAKERDLKYEEAFNAVIEEIAYTWFNRLVAIRFMEVNDYLPSRVRVLSSENSAKNEPDFVTTPFETDLEFTTAEHDKIMQLKDENTLEANNELFRMLFIKQCNKLNEILPEMFEQTNDYTELLLNIPFTDNDGIVYHLTHDIDEADWQDQVQIIGWLYQYYNTELKDDTFAKLKKNVKITKERVPAATQLFTPDWIVRYMVENSLGRLWIEGHPNEDLKSNWKYYLEEAEQEADVQARLEQIRAEYRGLNPKNIKVIDPCMGSGHILVYCFDVLMQIYESQGYTQRDAAQSIVKNNLYGLDIDNRATQLAYFSIMMKARQYDRRFFDRKIAPNVYAIQESNGFNTAQLHYFGSTLDELEKNNALNQANKLIEDMHDAKEYGSILTLDDYDWNLLRRFANEYKINKQIDFDSIGIEETQAKLQRLIETGEVLGQKYLICVTNPPYMGASGMSTELSKYVKDNYPDSKSDLFAVFIEKCGTMTAPNGYQAMITQHAWMFLSSFEKLRVKLLAKDTVNMAHLGARAFEEIGGEVVQTTSFVFANRYLKDYSGTYCRLLEPNTQQGKENMFLASENRYTAKQSNFSKIPGSRVAYWLSNNSIEIFSRGTLLNDIAEIRQGLATSDNNRYLRLWYEIGYEAIDFRATSTDDAKARGYKWFPFNKGGSFRKWYGNLEYIVDYYDDGADMKANVLRKYPYLNTPDFVVKNTPFYFKPSITWTEISSTYFCVRYCPPCSIFSNKSNSIFVDDKESLSYILTFLCSKPADMYIKVINPTITTNVGDVAKVPILFDSQFYSICGKIATQNIRHAKEDWDSFETSWDFTRHPLVPSVIELREQLDSQFVSDRMEKFGKISWHFEKWQQKCEERFNQLKSNEEELNRIFIDIYGLQDELTPEIEDKDVTVRKADLQRDIKSLLSYAVGCMFGRYSLDTDGLAYAGGEWDDSKYRSFIPDRDNCIPITDEAYFEDDIVGRFVEFVKTVYGAETLEENLDFIAKALGNKGTTSREVIRNYFLNGFIKDHIKTYQKRPIYWLFDSGKQNGFKALVYMHRWNADTVGNLRVEYLHKMQHVYEREIQRMQETIDDGRDAREVTKATKRKDKLQKQLKETKDYDAMLAHIALSRIEIDLDDGVKVNYEKVQTARDGKKMQILAKI